MRVQRIDQAIQSDGIVPLEGLLRATGSSIPTLRRDLKYMRGKLGFPIVYSRKNNGYRYGSESGGEPVRVPAEAVLPHLWFSPSELPVLLAGYKSLRRLLESGAFSRLTEAEARAELARIYMKLGSGDRERKELLKRVTLEEEPESIPEAGVFETVVPGLAIGFGFCACRRGFRLVSQRRLSVSVMPGVSSLEISPLRMISRRIGWLLAVWMHEASALALLPVDRIVSARELQTRTHFVSQRGLAAFLENAS